MKNLIALTMLATVALSLAACNTINGMGEDLRALGNAVSSGFSN